MRKLADTELYNLYLSGKGQTDLNNAKNVQLYKNVGVITPEQISVELEQLKSRTKNSYFPLLSKGLALFNDFNGRIKLFNLGSNSRSPVPNFIPVLAGVSVNKMVDKSSNSRKETPTIFVNLYRVGSFSADESTYTGLNAATDLYSAIEGGVLINAIAIDGLGNNIFSDNTVLENLTRIYTNLFSHAIISAKTTYGGSDFQNDAALYLIARFFLTYVLDKPDSSLMHEIAYKSIKHNTGLKALEMYEDTEQIKYTSLSNFLKTFGEAFFNGEAINLLEFETKWTKDNGEGTMLAIEYVPFLLYFLFAGYHRATLGGSVRLYSRMPELEKFGMTKLYNQVTSIIR